MGKQEIGPRELALRKQREAAAGNTKVKAPAVKRKVKTKRKTKVVPSERVERS